MKPTVLFERQDALAIVTLSNPGKMNALNLSMWQDLGDVMNQLSADPSVRCVILRGEGEQAFAAGADVGEFPSVRANRAQARSYAEVTSAAMRAVAECQHPVIAMIHGVCVGGGLEIAALCDLRTHRRTGRQQLFLLRHRRLSDRSERFHRESQTTIQGEITWDR
jgi:enoyl-CoA hydratase